MYCDKCGVKLVEGAKFCSACGSPVRSQETNAQEPTPNANPNRDERIRIEDDRRPHNTVNNSGCRTILIIVVIIGLLLTMLSIGGCINYARYIVYGWW